MYFLVFFYVTAYVLIHQLAKSQDKKWVVYGMAVSFTGTKTNVCLGIGTKKKVKTI